MPTDRVAVIPGPEEFFGNGKEIYMAGQSNKSPTKEELVEAVLAEARKEAERIIAEARMEAEKLKVERVDPAQDIPAGRKRSIAQGEELVTVRLPRVANESGKYVSVNGENVVIPRGVEVRVKRKFYDVLVQSQEQAEIALDLMEGLRRDWQNRNK